MVGSDSGARIYWITAALQLALTLMMLLVASAGVSRPLLTGVLLAAMLIQVALIAGNSMPLRQAHAG